MLNSGKKFRKVLDEIKKIENLDNALLSAELYKDEREKFIQKSFNDGGKGFIDAVIKYGRNEKGLEINSIVESYFEYLELIGDFRIAQVYTTGCAQVGKTLGHFLLKIYTLSFGRCNTGWFYDRENTLEQNVPIMWRPISKYWINAIEKERRKKFNRRDDKINNTCYQLEQVTGVFGYVSTARKMGSGQAAAGSAVVAYQIDLAFLEERSQYAAGEGDPIKRRLDASSIPTKPIRELGTPGGGQGIELEMKSADHYFYPHYYCPDCENWFPLDPLGCLLKKIERLDMVKNKPVETYFSESGRPLRWHHEDETESINTAYIGCSCCGKKLEDSQRYEAKFKCITDKKTFLREYLDTLPKGVPEINHRISIHLSPLVRQKPNRVIASEIISEGLKVFRTDDWQQQMLGWASQTSACSVTLEMLDYAMKSPKPTKEPDIILAGIDVGRSEDWIVIVEYHYPENHFRMEIAEVIEKTIRVIKFGGGINRGEILNYLKEYNVNYGIIDNEPSMESSINLCRMSVLELGNQISGQKQTARQTMVVDGGIQYPCWNIRNEKFLQSVLEGFLLLAPDGYPLYRLPSEWEKWRNMPTDERSPLVHLCAPWRDNDNRWHRGKDNVDDLYYAFLFSEVAFYLQLTEIKLPTFKQGNYRM